MRYIFFLLFFLHFTYASTYALVVGIGDYKNLSERNDLVGIDLDINNIKEILTTFGVKNNDITTLHNEQASRKNLLAKLKSYIGSKENNKNSTFIFYFSGHGCLVKDINGDEADNYDEAFALYDLKNDSKKNVIYDGILLDDEFYFFLSQIRSKKILILDKCNSGTSYRGVQGYVKRIQGIYSLSSEFQKKLTVLGNSNYDLEDKPRFKFDNYLVLSATKDKQNSMSSQLGSLFTISLHDAIVMHKIKANYTLEDLEDFCNRDIKGMAYDMQNKGIPTEIFNPYFVPFKYLDNKFISLVRRKFLTNGNTDIDIPIEQMPVKPSSKPSLTNTSNNIVSNTLDILVSDKILKFTRYKPHYNHKDEITFDINTTKKGFLNIFTVYKDGYRLFWGNKSIKPGITYHFGRSLIAKKHLIALKSEGKTNIYAILSQKKLDIESFISKNHDSLEITNHFRNSMLPYVKYNKNKVSVQRAPDIKAINKISFTVK